ncbi:MAG: VanZ family protein [Candidatus Sumerlaeota bacterium]
MITSLIDRAIAATPQKLWWLNAAICAAVILYVGSRPASDIPDVNFISGLDKVLHFSAYSGFAACLFRACYPLKAHEKPTLSLPWAWVMLGPFLIGSIDEVHQAYVPGRGSDPKDLVADTLGGILVCIAGLYWRQKVRSRGR